MRDADDLPVPLTNRMAHHLLQAPPRFGVDEAFRYAQVLGLGGDERLARSVLATRIGTDFGRDDVWLPLILWLVAHPSLDTSQHGPIVDYVYDQKFVPSVPNPETRVRGRARGPLHLPPQPDLSLAGRSPESVLRRVAEWHKELGSRRLGGSTRWKPTGIAPLVVETEVGGARRIYELTELISARELEEEGRALGHCVATYWQLCESGVSSIWSFSTDEGSGQPERRLTVEVRTADRLIVQARGIGNRVATEEEMDVLMQWADSGGPGVSDLVACHLRYA